MKLTCALFVLLVGCIDPELGSTGSFVIGGQPTQPGAFPGVGALMLDLGQGPQVSCTGTLIAPDAVLTAAHCLDPQFTGGLMPGFTLALDPSAGSPVVTAGRAAFQHDRFSLTGGAVEGLAQLYDIGILLLAHPITEVEPVPMPRPEDSAELVANLDMEIAGYGKTNPATDDYGVLFDAKSKLASLNPSEMQVGTGAPQPQNCNGDSGGPGFALVGGKRRLIGIVSRSFAGLMCSKGGIDTRVDAYLDFIHSKVMSGIPCSSGMAEPCPTPPGGEEDAAAGCCSTSTRGAPGSVALALLIGVALLRRRPG